MQELNIDLLFSPNQMYTYINVYLQTIVLMACLIYQIFEVQLLYLNSRSEKNQTEQGLFLEVQECKCQTFEVIQWKAYDAMLCTLEYWRVKVTLLFNFNSQTQKLGTEFRCKDKQKLKTASQHTRGYVLEVKVSFEMAKWRWNQVQNRSYWWYDVAI